MSAYEKVTDLSYGENPHQRAAYYSQVGARMHVLSQVRQRGGKELSFNNVLDINSGRLLVQEFEVPACAIIKHNNPCGVAVGGTALEAYRRAFACDPVSAFGGVICLNRPVDAELAKALIGQFFEVVLAPRFTDEAVEILSTKPNLRILEDKERRRVNISEWDVKRVIGGLLVQDRDLDLEDRSEMEVVTERKPSEREWGEMLFAWRVCKHVRSNAIVLARDLASVGIGAGQMSRVDSVRLAIDKARATDTDLTGGALASDAFFPFSDGPAAGGRRGRHRGHPAGRLGARPRGRRGRRRRRHLDGVHPPAAFPPLTRRANSPRWVERWVSAGRGEGAFLASWRSRGNVLREMHAGGAQLASRDAARRGMREHAHLATPDRGRRTLTSPTQRSCRSRVRRDESGASASRTARASRSSRACQRPLARRQRLAAEAEVQVALHHPHERLRGLVGRRAGGSARPRSPRRCGARWRRRRSARARCTPARRRDRRPPRRRARASPGRARRTRRRCPSSASRAICGPSPVPRNQRSDIVQSSDPRCSTTRSTRWWRSRKYT